MKPRSVGVYKFEIAPEYKVKVFEETGDVDFGYEIPNISRFRANFFNQKNGVAAVFRQIPSKVLSFEDFEKFDAPLPPVLKKLAMLHKGLVVVTGPTGPPGSAGTPGPAGKQGKRGLRGKPGRNATIACKVKRHRRGRKTVRCTVKHAGHSRQ